MTILILIAMAVAAIVILDLRGRLKQLERRIGLLERGLSDLPAPAADVVEPSVEMDQREEPPAPEPVSTILRAGSRAQIYEPAQRLETDEAEAERVEPEPEPARPGRTIGFEELFGRKLPIWAGGVTLAIAGMLIVKYSIDLGLLSPLVRVVNGLLFGFALIAGAELARRKESWVSDERVRQALAGAGIATLYGSILVAANIYQLIGPVPALVGMAGVTALAMFLALRFGAPSALLGLVGGLAAPALVGSGDPNIPLLSLYLALAVGGLCALSRSQRWAWLGMGALIGGFGWGGLLLLAGTLDTAATLSIGAYLMLLGVLLPLFSFGGGQETRIRLGGSLVAAVQMAGLVATGGFTLLHWGLFGFISIAIVWLARRDPRLWLLPPSGLAIALLLLAAWPNPALASFAVAAGAMVLIYSLPALLAVWTARGRVIEAGQIAAAALGVFLAAMLQFHDRLASPEQVFSFLALGAALLPASAAALGFHTPARQDDGRFALLATAAALLVAAAAVLALPGWGEGPAIAAVAAGLLVLRLKAGDRRIEWSAWPFLASALGFLLLQHPSQEELARAFGQQVSVDTGLALVRWAACGTIAALFAWRATWIHGRPMAQAAAALLLYGAAAQLLPVDLLPLVPATGLALLTAWGPRLPHKELLPAIGALFLAAIGWALLPLAQWGFFALASLTGEPLLVGHLPPLGDAAMRLFIPSLVLAIAVWWARSAMGMAASRAGTIAAGVLGGVALHIFYKQIFAISSATEFVALGLAERISWEALLLGGAAAAWAVASSEGVLRRIAWALLAAAAAHFTLYSLVLHNPLWNEQAVGWLPLLNLLPLSFAVPAASLWLLMRYEPAFQERHARSLAAVQMGLLLIFGFSMLRQLFHGSILVEPGVTDVEDISRSVLAIALAIGFLLWGIARGSHAWRIGSLIVMLAAVAKVFLFDASGLEGLARILSFVALGFSLIGIGWLYSRHLNAGSRPAQEV